MHRTGSEFPSIVLRKPVTDSTMDDARDAVRSGYGHGTLCLSDSQRHGRGRMPGRIWSDNGQDSLLFTLVLDKDSVRAAYPLTQMLALSLCRRLERAYGLTPAVKWPNDVLVEGKKIAGILVETEGGYLLAGMGVNMGKGAVPSEIRESSTSLSQVSGKNVTPEEEWSGLMEEIRNVLDNPPSVGDIQHRLAGINEPVSVLLGDPAKKNRISGVLAGLQDDGALLVRCRGGEIRPVYSGETEKYDS